MSAEKYYRDRVAIHDAALENTQKALQWLPWARGLCFLLFLVMLAVGFTAPTLQLLWFTLAGAGLVSLLLVAARHERREREVARLRLLQRVNQWALARLNRKWSELPEPPIPPDADTTTADLNLFGRASLMELTSTAHTEEGVACLSRWLANPAPPKEIELRQDAVRLLAPLSELRETLQVEARLLSASHAGPHRLGQWAASPRWMSDKPIIRVIRWIGPLATLGGLFALALGASPPAVAVVILASAMAQVLCVIRYVGELHDIFNSVSTGAGEVQSYSRLFRLAAQLPSDNDLLREIRDALSNEHSLMRLHRLRWIMAFSDFRRGLTAPLYMIAQVLLMWDFQVIARLDQWKKRHGEYVQAWFVALGRWEALASLAALRHDHPHWCFPKVRTEDPAGLEATQLGHPLLSNQGRVCNDVALGPPGKFLLVTGSNMSGKSTLLRALGVNIALAQAGGPVCAESMTMTPMLLVTSMRVSDSLEQGVSFFMAELQRLKFVVELAQRCGQDRRRVLCFLLDEILQGTNSQERHIAVTHILERLSTMYALGAVSTHDLELAKQPELAESCRPVHFSEGFSDDGGLVFEFRLHEGVTQTTNALKLLKIVGL